MPSILALCLGTGVAAQADDPATLARELLAAQSPIEQAHGAHLAARSGDETLTPLILRALARLEPGIEHRRLVQRALVGALVELRATVPPAELQRFAAALPTEAILLAARDPAAHQEMLASLDDGALQDGEWLAVHNLLLQARSQLLAPRLLRALELQLSIHVVNGARLAGGGGSYSSSIGCGSIAVPRELPPLTLFTLTTSGKELIASGPFPVYVERRVLEPGRTHGLGGRIHASRRDGQRLRYVAAMLGDQHSIDLGARTDATVRWRDVAALAADVDAWRQAIAAAFADVATALVHAGWLDAATAAELQPTVRVELHDARSDRTTPLPEIPGVRRR